MQHEPIKYQQNLPFSANFINLRDEPVHCHREIEILLLLRGFSHCKIYHMDYALLPGDMIIADVEDLHAIHGSSEDVLMLQLHLDTKKFEEIYPNISATYFVCEDPGSQNGNEDALRSKQLQLKHQLAKLMMDSLGNPSDFVLQTDNVNNIVATLVRHFRGFYIEDYQFRVGRDNVSETDLDRMSRITSYLLSHYDKKVALEDVAAMEHLNPYYVSHLIKKTLGIPFQNFVNGIRLEFAEKSLLFTNQSLTQVAENCGFSSLNYFNKCFHAWYGFTPAQYRKAIPKTGRVTGIPFTRPEAMELIGGFLAPVVAIKRLTLAPSMDPMPANNPHLDGEPKSLEALRPLIQIRNSEDLLGLGFLRERISAIHPAGFLVNPRLLAPVAYSVLQTFGIPVQAADTPLGQDLESTVQNTAMALAQITSQSKNTVSRSAALSIPLFGRQNALFLPEGLASPHYTAFQLLSGVCGGQLLVSPQALMSGTVNGLSVVLFNPDPRAILNVRLETKNLPEQFILMKKQIPEENNCYTILEALNHPVSLPTEVVREIDQAHLGLPHFLMVDREVSPVLDFMIYPQHVTLLVFSASIPL